MIWIFQLLLGIILIQAAWSGSSWLLGWIAAFFLLDGIAGFFRAVISLLTSLMTALTDLDQAFRDH